MLERNISNYYYPLILRRLIIFPMYDLSIEKVRLLAGPITLGRPTNTISKALGIHQLFLHTLTSTGK